MDATLLHQPVSDIHVRLEDSSTVQGNVGTLGYLDPPILQPEPAVAAARAPAAHASSANPPGGIAPAGVYADDDPSEYSSETQAHESS